MLLGSSSQWLLSLAPGGETGAVTFLHSFWFSAGVHLHFNMFVIHSCLFSWRRPLLSSRFFILWREVLVPLLRPLRTAASDALIFRAAAGRRSLGLWLEVSGRLTKLSSWVLTVLRKHCHLHVWGVLWKKHFYCARLPLTFMPKAPQGPASVSQHSNTITEATSWELNSQI